LSVFPYGLAFADACQRHFVAARHAFARGHARGYGSGGNLIDGDNDIVIGR
jgi:hypothetical protein